MGSPGKKVVYIAIGIVRNMDVDVDRDNRDADRSGFVCLGNVHELLDYRPTHSVGTRPSNLLG